MCPKLRINSKQVLIDSSPFLLLLTGIYDKTLIGKANLRQSLPQLMNSKLMLLQLQMLQGIQQQEL